MSELSLSIAGLNRKANTLSRQARESKERWGEAPLSSGRKGARKTQKKGR